MKLRLLQSFIDYLLEKLYQWLIYRVLALTKIDDTNNKKEAGGFS